VVAQGRLEPFDRLGIDPRGSLVVWPASPLYLRISRRVRNRFMFCHTGLSADPWKRPYYCCHPSGLERTWSIDRPSSDTAGGRNPHWRSQLRTGRCSGALPDGKRCQVGLIVRIGWNTLQLSTLRGQPFDLIGYLQRLPAGMRPHEIKLHGTAGRGATALPLRRIVQRKTPEATEATRLALRRAAIRRGKNSPPAAWSRRNS
jgi:hypothetical protein